MKKNFIVPLVIYPFDVMISINETFDDFAKAVIKKWDKTILDDFKKFDKPHSEGFAYVYSSEGHLCSIIKLQNFKKNYDCYGTLQHEIFHCVEFVFRKCGIYLSEDSHEAYAYLIGFITREIYKNI